ncbi:flavodoxin [Ruminococcus sp. NK3A76]|uniref:flavodoxin n=1 Tax=Ruminococcus sp. NK3A76 TaxID=877411 RepID=UPI0018DB5417|nr:flavodoxin [Ruminococcus sp. NK3A76]
MAACQATAGTSEESQVPDTSTAAQENADNEVTEDESSGSMIVVYYSWSENTKSIAKRIAETTGADIYEIRTVKAYPKDGYETSDIAQEERRTGNLPEIVDDLPDLKEYSTVIIGGLIWKYVSTPLARYLELTDLSEKTVIPFSTSQGSGQSSYLKDFRNG